MEGNEVTQDDARSEVECPQGYIVTGCRCSTAECDGAFTESLQKCYAHGSYKQVPVKVGLLQNRKTFFMHMDIHRYIYMYIYIYIYKCIFRHMYSRYSIDITSVLSVHV